MYNKNNEIIIILIYALKRTRLVQSFNNNEITI